MKPWACTRVLSQEEMEMIHDGTCRVLEELGLKVEHEGFLRVLEDFGYPVDRSEQVVRFPRKVVEDYLGRAGGRRREFEGLRFNAGGYPARYLDPVTGEVRPHTLKSSSDMARLADALENIDTMNCIGIPSDVPLHVQPLYKKLLSWKTRKPYSSGEITRVEELPFYIELCERYCEHTGRDLKDVATVNVHKDYPLFLDRSKAELLMAARRSGLRVGIGSGIPSVGLTAPVTLAGAMVVLLADQLSDMLVNRAFSEDPDSYPELRLYNNVGVIDMRNGLNCTSRPEAYLITLAMGDMADFYGAAGLSDGFGKTQAKTVASVQSGVERFGDMLTGVYAGATSFGSLGIISEPEGINSAVQLVIDDEIAGMLRRIAEGFRVDEEKLALEVIKGAGHRPFFLGEEHTARHMREEIWMSEVFIGGVGYDRWLEEGGRTEVDRAREKAMDVLSGEPPQVLDEECEGKLLEVIGRAEKALR